MAFQANTHYLYIWNGDPGTAGYQSTNTGFAMHPGTSPSAAWDADGVLVC